MSHNDIIARLKSVIARELTPLIDNDYVYLDLPYYENSGDLLIWEGTLAFLKGLPYRCLYSTDKSGYVRPPLSADKVILLHGGGNWGDIWPEHHEFRKRVIEDFPENRIIVLPQSVHYENPASLEADVEFFSRHESVVICVRDSDSFRILSEALPNRILLVPDMAFCIDPDTLKPRHRPWGRRVLYARRLDKEMPADLDVSAVPANAEMRDWPIIENIPQALFRMLRHRLRRLRRPWNRFGQNRANGVTDAFWHDVIRPAYLRNAVDFVGRYSVVYSTRLHVSILSILMGKELHVLDNSYGKTRKFLDTWIPDWERTLAEPQPESAAEMSERELPGSFERYLAEDVEIMRYRQVEQAFRDSWISNRSARMMLEDFVGLYPQSEYVRKLRWKHLAHRVLGMHRYPRRNFSDRCGEVYAAGNSADGHSGVLLLSHEMTSTPATRALLDVAVALKQAGYSPVVVSLQGGELLKKAEAEGIPAYVDALMRYDFLRNREERYRYAGSFPVVVFNTAEMMRYVENFIGLPCRKTGWIHESPQLCGEADGHAALAQFAGFFDRICCTSDSLLNEVLQHGVPRDKTGILTPADVARSGQSGQSGHIQAMMLPWLEPAGERQQGRL